ncbi:MAG: hypothetical protein ACRELC_03595 [Gemmatimonadota bacterium]
MQRAFDLSFPILEQATGKFWAFLPLARSPVLVIVAAGGTILGTWEGVLGRDARDEVRRSLKACESAA